MRIPFDYPIVITQTFSEHEARRIANGWKQYNGGIDYAIPTGTPLYACADGQVIRAEMDATGYGMHVRIQHDGGLLSLYGHMNDVVVQVGHNVTIGQMIGRSGNTGNSTGPHLHFELRLNGVAVDPQKYLDGTPEEEAEPAETLTNAEQMNIRSGPGIGYGVRSVLPAGSKVQVLERESWVMTPAGWVCEERAGIKYLK
jgi:hypothetical protein